MAVNLLIRGTQASLQLPFSWGYIDRPAGMLFFFRYFRVCYNVLTTQTLGQHRWRFISRVHPLAYGIPKRWYEVSRERTTVHYRRRKRSSASSSPSRYSRQLLTCDTRVQEVEVMESKFGFIPGSGENVANRIRRKFRMVKGGNPQLILVHYGRSQAARESPSPIQNSTHSKHVLNSRLVHVSHCYGTIAVNPAFNQPTRAYPLQPANLPAVYVAGEKAGQKVMPNTGGGPPVGNVPGGIPPGMQGNMPGGIPGGMTGGMGGGMPGGPGGPGPQQLPPNPGAGPGQMQGVPNQPHPSHPGHPPIQPPGPQGVPPPMGMGYSGPATTQSMLAQQNRQMEALERRNAQEREQRARGSMNAVCIAYTIRHRNGDAESYSL